MDITLNIFSSNHIDVMVESNGESLRWRLAGVYGDPVTGGKELSRSRQLLRRFEKQFNLPWAYVGDFNEIISFNEKDGRLARPWVQIRAFQNALSDGL